MKKHEQLVDIVLDKEPKRTKGFAKEFLDEPPVIKRVRSKKEEKPVKTLFDICCELRDIVPPYQNKKKPVEPDPFDMSYCFDFSWLENIDISNAHFTPIIANGEVVYSAEELAEKLK